MDISVRKCILLAVTLLLFPEKSVPVSQQVLTKTLHDYLFTDYDSNLIPVCVADGNVTLNMDVALRQVMEVNERDQLLTMNIWLRMTWNDCRLTWTPASYSNISYLMVKYADVWVPDITLYDSAAEEVMFPGIDDYRVYISSSGSLSYNFPTVTKSICRVNVQYFPFDTQRCPLQFGSWSHHGLELDVVNRNDQGDTANFIQNPEWDIEEFPVERHVLYYNCCPEPYPDITFYVVITRRPAFYLLTMMFPCILTSSVAAVGFLLPVESGEKVSLGITVLLSLAVFLLVVSESLPPSSDNFPIIGSYFAASMVLVSLSLLQTVIILNVFYRGTTGRRVPRWAKVIFFKYIGRFVCIQSNETKVSIVDSDEEDPEKAPPDMKCHSNVSVKPNENEVYHSKNESNGISEEVLMEPINGRIGILPRFAFKDPNLGQEKEQTSHLKNIDRYFKECKRDETIMSEWRDLSNILDRFFLILYSLITVITTLAFLLQCAVQ